MAVYRILKKARDDDTIAYLLQYHPTGYARFLEIEMQWKIIDCFDSLEKAKKAKLKLELQQGIVVG